MKSRGIASKWPVLLGYVLIAVLIVVFQEPLMAAMSREEDIPWLVFGLGVLFALVPVIPYGLFGGLTGAMYGTVFGALITWSASTTAALVMFWLVRYLFAEQAERFLRRYDKLNRFTVLFERNAFLAILFARLIPIIPAAAVNIYSGLVKVPLWVFFTATALGKLPTMVVFATVGEQALSSWRNLLLAIAIYAVFLSLVFLFYRRIQKKLSL
jgi:uncharacterized membrane protein YdjX (TVP38/TMEM64 family)